MSSINSQLLSERYQALMTHEKYQLEEMVPVAERSQWLAGQRLNDDPKINACQLRMNVGKIAMILLPILGAILAIASGISYGRGYAATGEALMIAAGATAGVGLIGGGLYALYWKKRLVKELGEYDKVRDDACTLRERHRWVESRKESHPKEFNQYIRKHQDDNPCDRDSCAVCDEIRALLEHPHQD